MANSLSHAALAYPVKGARFTLIIGYLNSSGVPTDPVSPDTEISVDGGAFANCTETPTVISGSGGAAYLTLTGAEMNCSIATLLAKVASGPNNALIPEIRPRVLPVLYSGTAANPSGSATTITMPSSVPAYAGLYRGCIVRTTGGAGGGGTGGANNQARIVKSSAVTSGLAVLTVEPNWEVNTDNTTTFELLITEGAWIRGSDLQLMGGDLTVVSKLFRALNTETLVTCAASSVTNVVTSSLSPAAIITDQYKGKVLSFDALTLSTQLRGCSTRISTSTNLGVLTVDALPFAPIAGDTAVIT